MGHVDHGKTSLLDALRQTDVAAHEAGGITQHIGAYQVTLDNGGKITFIDTPGHAAFTEMRARGANVTDIVVLVVAADDGIMPQTVEAIHHAKAAKVPIIVAINKIDKPDADPDRVRSELLQHELVVEELGGDVLGGRSLGQEEDQSRQARGSASCCRPKCWSCRPTRTASAQGAVIEAKLERGRGTVATVLVQRGTLKVGDILVAGASGAACARWSTIAASTVETRRSRDAGRGAGPATARRWPATSSSWSRPKPAPARSPSSVSATPARQQHRRPARAARWSRCSPRSRPARPRNCRSSSRATCRARSRRSSAR